MVAAKEMIIELDGLEEKPVTYIHIYYKEKLDIEKDMMGP